MTRHDAFRRFFPRVIVKVLAARDRRAGLDWSKPTRLDQEINRVFVKWKTTRSDRMNVWLASAADFMTRTMFVENQTRFLELELNPIANPIDCRTVPQPLSTPEST